MGTSTTSLKINNHTQYQGQVLQNIPNGKGTLTISSQNTKNILWNINGQFKNGQLINCHTTHQNIVYQGTVKAGTLSGTGKVYNIGKNIKYEGIFQNGIFISGVICRQNKYIADCSYVQDQLVMQQDKQNVDGLLNIVITNRKLLKLHGQGEYICSQNKQKVKGNFENGQLQGKGSYYFNNGDIYYGNFKNGYMQGFGHYHYHSNSHSHNKLQVKQIYGYFKQSKCTSNLLYRNRNGNKSKSNTKNKQNNDSNYNNNNNSNNNNNNQITKIIFKNGDQYQGQMNNNKMHGQNNMYQYKDGTIYKGSFYNNQLSGNCQIIYGKDSSIQKYKGQISKGVFNGLGVIQYKNGIIFKGFFLNNKKNGPSIIIYGQTMWKCLYVMDQLIGQLTLVQIQKNQ